MANIRFLTVGGFMAELTAVVAADFGADLGSVGAESLVYPVFVGVEISQVLEGEVGFGDHAFHVDIGTVWTVWAKADAEVSTQKLLLRRYHQRENSLLRLNCLMTHLTFISGLAEA